MNNKVFEKIKEKTKYVLDNCALSVLLVISCVAMVIAGVVYTLANGQQLKFDEKKPVFASLMMNTDEEAQEEDIYEFEGETEEEVTEPPTEEPTTTEDKNTEGTQEETQNQNPPEEETGYKTEFVEKKKVKSRSQYYKDPGLTALTTSYPYTEVDESYFDDALFIGDSRIEGLKLYSGLDNATFYSKEGTTIYKILSEKMVPKKVKGKEKKVTIITALKEAQYKKIYIMLGINELGYKTTEEFAEKYKDVIRKLSILQPDAKIYICGIMNVTSEYSDAEKIVNNDNINAKNVAIAKIADGERIFYLDVNPELCNSKGGIKAKYSWDGIHLKAEYYEIWVDFLKRHAVVEE